MKTSSQFIGYFQYVTEKLYENKQLKLLYKLVSSNTSIVYIQIYNIYLLFHI